MEEALHHSEHAMAELDRLGDTLLAAVAASQVAVGLVIARGDTDRAEALIAERRAAVEHLPGAEGAQIQ